MKTIYPKSALAALFSLTAFCAHAQIPNAGFESWTTDSSLILRNWDYSPGLSTRVAGKSGGYALNLKNVDQGFDQFTGYASLAGPSFDTGFFHPAFPIASVPDSHAQLGAKRLGRQGLYPHELPGRRRPGRHAGPFPALGIRPLPKKPQRHLRSGILIPLLSCLNLACQDAPAAPAAAPSYAQYSFLRIAQNRILNDSLLLPFYEKMHGLLAGDSQGQYNILHIGDSHLQADFLTAVSRTGLQAYFGNAGRGLLVPHKLTKSNEALDYWLKTQAQYRFERLLKTKKMFDVGPAGLALRFDGTNPVIPIDIIVKPDSVLDYSFSCVRMLGQARAGYEGELRVYTTENKLLFSGPNVPGQTVQLAEKTQAIYFDMENRDHKYVDLHGFVLSNEKPGLLYHTIGINGARYIDYRRNPSAMKGWGQLNPDLFILSLGTNEVILWEFDPNKNIRQLDSFFSLFRELYPEVPVIIELPFDHKFRRARTNARFPLLNANLVRMADKYRAAIWDGYHAGGGYGSAYYWNRAGLLTYDGIHYTREGYRVQGEMLRDAIINGYGDRFNEGK